MARRLVVLAALLPSLALTGCETSTSVELKTIRITQPGIPIQGTGIPGIPLQATTTFDLGAATEAASISDAAVVELTTKSIRLVWEDPATQPDFSGITNARFEIVPDPASGLPAADIASYTQNPANPNPLSVDFTGRDSLNVFDLLVGGGQVTLNAFAEGSIIGTIDTTATVIVEFNMLVEVEPTDLATGGGGK
jgi:hypothetical protein